MLSSHTPPDEFTPELTYPHLEGAWVVPSSMRSACISGPVLDELRAAQGAKLRLMRNFARPALAAAALLTLVAAFMVTSHAQGQLPPGGPPAPFDLDAIFQERRIAAQFD